MTNAPSVKWTREHSLIALNLYCKLPFGRLHRSNPIIIETADKMGRTASSLAMKLCNFASLDPVLKARGVKGLPGVSRHDREIWDEFQSNLPRLGEVSEQLIHDLFTLDESKEVDFLQQNRITLEKSVPTFSESTQREATVKVRRGQQFFRQSVLIAYGTRCCISGISVPRLLVASHIKPWSDFPEVRLEPRNGLCLSALHDAAFDAGLLTVDESLNVALSTRLKRFFPELLLEQNFARFEGASIRLPEKLVEPDAACLRYHREVVFQA
jgi:putative restriction endonuclease